MVLQSLATSMPQVSWRDEVTFMVAKCPAMPAHLVRSPWESQVLPRPQHRLSRTSSRTSCLNLLDENYARTGEVVCYALLSPAMLAPRFIVSLAEVGEPSVVPSFERTVLLRFLGLLRFWTFEVKSQLDACH